MTSTTSSPSMRVGRTTRRRNPAIGLFLDGCFRYGQAALVYLVVWALVFVHTIYPALVSSDEAPDAPLAGLTGTGVGMAFVFA